MKKIINIFFVTLGVSFLVLILITAYFYFVNSTNLAPAILNAGSDNGESVDKHPTLSESQEKALSTFGIDPSELPSEITPEQEACFEEKLGAERVAEIKAGNAPTATDYFKAKGCI